MRLDLLIVSMVLGVVFVAGGLLVINENTQTYNLTIDNTSFQNVTALLKNVTVDSDDMKDDTDIPDVSESESWDDLIKNTYNSITKVWKFVKLPGALLEQTALAFGVPTIIVNTIMQILKIVIIFGLIYLVFRFMPR